MSDHKEKILRNLNLLDMKNIIFLSLLFFIPLANSADFEKGLVAAKNGEFSIAYSAWYPLAEQGNADAQYFIGVMYVKHQDDKQAAKWFQKAAVQGNVDAQYNLGMMYSSGSGVLQDDKQAAKWYQKAAEQGFADAQYFIGVRYAKGSGVHQDYKKSYMWLNLARYNGYKETQKALDIIIPLMVSEDISKAQESSKICLRSDYKNCD